MAYSSCRLSKDCPVSVTGNGNGCCDSGDDVWDEMCAEVQEDAEAEPLVGMFYAELVLSRPSLEAALAAHLAAKLCIPGALPQGTLRDLLAVRDRDPACAKMVHCFLYNKGFLALQAHRAAHALWSEGRTAAALLLQSRASEVFGVDIHPGARIGGGIMLDHATGVVIGETAVVGDDVSILHAVTLGGTRKVSGDRHPKVGDGVLIGAGPSVLGNVRIGDGAKIGAGAVVLRDVPCGTTGRSRRHSGGRKTSQVSPWNRGGPIT
ncbi:hypothetical protein QYE76_064038 [Lolium multiflorum]|uniref:serine O-acetyltransferase n=1 Tax=Lolium multiflorum TaxID=4521 RepID=A0AAD8W7L3_LOLMU|nr:hypothetical protein QYE76_064038 [Lolium multiflorum]